MGDDYERIICVKQEVFVYKIPPRQSSRGYRAADWKLDQPDWSGRLRIVVINNKCVIKFEDKTSGELFAQAPITEYPGPSVESVSDSSRYFVIKIENDGGRHAFIGMGFSDRGDSFDFNVSLQDHFKREKVEDNVSAGTTDPPLDLRFKEGQTIKINFGNKSEQDTKPRPKANTESIGILPPPPGGVAKIAPPPGSTQTTTTRQQTPSQPSAQQPTSQPTTTDWGDFAAFSNNDSSKESSNWVQF